MKVIEAKSKILHTIIDTGKFSGEYENEQYINQLYEKGCIDSCDRRELENYNRMLCK